MVSPVSAGPPDRVWTLPNLISLSRLFIILPLTILLLVRENYGAALVSIVALGVTDWLDGFLARRMDLVTEFGKNLDPWADRIAIVAVGTALVLTGLLPWPFLLVIFGTDLLVGILALKWFGGPPRGLAVTDLGKLRTAGFLVAFPLLILAAALQMPPIWVAGLVILAVSTIGHVIAGFGYCREMLQIHRSRVLDGE